MERNCLLIDNEDQSSSIEEIEREARKNNVSIKCHQFNVGSTTEPRFLTENKIDPTKVIQEFNSQFNGISFDLIAFDWDLDDEQTNGVELIRVFQHEGIRRSTPKLLYSGVLKVKIEGLLEEYKAGKIDFKAAWKDIKTLIEINIVDFKDRDEYEKSIVSYLKKNSPVLEEILLKELRNNKDLKFHGLIGSLEGKTFEEVADTIELRADIAEGFKISLIEQATAYLADMKYYK